ncbi:uncharacterized protein CLUP02_09336 [Colletotrichum lupini]|uniref:Uncharacterized protein n=1 Tax=Colletotrichum lupini TaxID=145971 RepID=A0A9Q8WIH5_9PEZI|nr:uncharacterized protein CLUP02_09336 [Colletotrichum lupini]UQC83840.1 hypothetical protein CLUP02_09336 [Colletotrichum lupini]
MSLPIEAKFEGYQKAAVTMSRWANHHAGKGYTKKTKEAP